MDESTEQSWLTTSIARHIWKTKYLWFKSGEPRDRDIEATWRRVARAVASVLSYRFGTEDGQTRCSLLHAQAPWWLSRILH